jgi:tripartite-type tricarboxylate transporter receptor subunit TctC
MKFRLFSTLMMWAAGLVGGIVSAPTAQAQTETYPSRPITLLVPAAAGGTTDLAARMISEPLSKAFGQQVVVDNRPGETAPLPRPQSRAPSPTAIRC